MPIEIPFPDLSLRPNRCSIERVFPCSSEMLFAAWTQRFDVWFAAPGTVDMRAEIGAAFYFATEFEGQRHPHYGRFLNLVPSRLVVLTWVTGYPGTEGSETIVRVELTPIGDSTLLRLTHEGFPNIESMQRHRDAWPLVLEQMERKLKTST
jgi:uncharacterized protein YndB with AHSA1/START domain